MIRKISLQDRSIFLTMSEEFYASPAVEHAVPHDFHVRAFDEMMRSDDYIEGFLLMDDTVPAGYALLQKTYSREAGGLTIWIDEIYLRPAFRGKGLAKAFFAFAETLGASGTRKCARGRSVPKTRIPYDGISLHGKRSFVIFSD